MHLQLQPNIRPSVQPFDADLLSPAVDRFDVQAGLQETDVEVANMGVEEGAKALAEGKVDAAALWEPLLSKQENSDGATKLFTSAEIPGQVLDILVVQKDIAEQRPDDVANLIRGWEQALQLLHTRLRPAGLVGRSSQPRPIVANIDAGHSPPTTFRNASTARSSKCVPDNESMCSRAWSTGQAARYGRSERIASHTSTTAKMRAASGIDSPVSPRG
jgi:hypothetical protein